MPERHISFLSEPIFVVVIFVLITILIKILIINATLINISKEIFHNFLFTFYSGLFRVYLISSRWYFICGPKLKPCIGFIVIKSIFISAKLFYLQAPRKSSDISNWINFFEVVTFVFCAPCLSWNLFWFHFKIAFCLPFFLLRPTHCSIAKVIFNLCARLSKQAPFWSWAIPQGNFGTPFFS